MLALTQDTAEAIFGMIAIVLGFVACGVLWWLMVLRPSRQERRARDERGPGR